PEYLEHPPLEPVFETFDPPAQRSAKIELHTSFPMPRVWFLNSEGTELVQIQGTRFIHNWRAGPRGEEYPRYSNNRKRFNERVGRFTEFLRKEKLGELSINQCEITYVNHIYAEDGWERWGELENVFSPWTGEYSDDFLKEPEDCRIHVRYVIPDASGSPIGRLHVSVDPHVALSGNKQLFVMKLTARGRPIGEGLDGALRFIDIGHEWIVRGFTSFTTKAMQNIWGRKDVG
ncbi:MAG: TIGR04255 family protein, partial [Planctomycetota bacterium]